MVTSVSLNSTVMSSILTSRMIEVSVVLNPKYGTVYLSFRLKHLINEGDTRHTTEFTKHLVLTTANVELLNWMISTSNILYRMIVH